MHRHPLFANGQPDVSVLINKVMGADGHRERGLVGVGFHPDYPDLVIFNYTDECTFTKAWDDVTMVCRGLILDIVTKEVVALGFPKFFNLSEQFAPRVRLDAPYEVREKMDGSFGICFFYQGQWHVATRGSFVSDQAKHATELLRSGKSGLDPTRMNVQRTYLSEIIYPENRVVVSYGDTDDLCLLGGFDLTTGEEVELENLAAGTRHSHRNVWTPERFVFSTFEEMVAWVKELPGSQESVVVRYTDTNERFKLKSISYCQIHRMISRITPLGVYDVIVSGDDLEDVRRGIPEEFIEEFDRIHSLITSQADERVAQVIDCANRYSSYSDKELGLAISQKNLIDPVNDQASIGFVFTYRKRGEQEVRKAVFKAIRPTGNILRGFDGTKIAMNKRTSAND